MALSIIGSSSLVFGRTAKAATLNSPSNKITSSSWTNYRLGGQINSDGYYYWCEITGATEYQTKVVYLPTNQCILGSDGDASYLEEKDLTLYNYNTINRVGKYSVTIKALNSNKNVIAQETFYFYYDGSTTKQL